MARLVPQVLVVLAASLIVSVVGIGLFLFLSPCPMMTLNVEPWGVGTCDWWGITCLKCNA